MNVAIGQNGKESLNLTFLVQNTLVTVNNVSQQDNWTLPELTNFSYTLEQCIDWGNLVILNGTYSLANISQAPESSIMPLQQPGVFDNCTYYEFALYSFQPSSSSATEYGGGNQGQLFSYGTRPVIGGDEVTGYYQSNQSYTTLNKFLSPVPFPVGEYTVAAGDEWGQLALLHFSVTAQEISSTTISLSGGTTFENATISSVYFTKSTATVQSTVPTSNKTFAYDEISPSFWVGNFSIQLADNGTGYTSPPENDTSRMYTGFVFAFNITTPDRKTTNLVITWWPPCSKNLGLPCEQDNGWVLPQPENYSLVYDQLANLVVRWYTTPTGLFVTFQEWDTVNTTTVYTVTTDSPPNPSNDTAFFTTNSLCFTSLTTATVIETSSVPNSNGSTTTSLWTTTFNPCY